MSVIVILIAAGVGLLIGSRVTFAHDAHERFIRYRTATNSSFSSWFKSTVAAAIFIVIGVLVIYEIAVHVNG